MRTFDHVFVDSAVETYRRIVNLRAVLEMETARLADQLDNLSTDAVAAYNRRVSELGE